MDNFYVVAIGTSAGGFQALRTFFSHNVERPDVAYIIVQHLSRNHRSQLSFLLQRYTNLKVKKIEGGERVEINKIYVMPESKKLEVIKRTLKLTERPESEIVNRAVDHFFISIAKDVKDKTIGIILSGTGDDGVEGAKAIEAKGGIVLVQDPKTADFTGMPKNAISKDHPSQILHPKELPKAVINYTRRGNSL